MSAAFQMMRGADRVIRGDLFACRASSRGTLVICHGFKGFKDWGMFPYLGERFSEDYDVVTFNFSHNGVGEDVLQFGELEKFARETYSRDLEDLQAVIGAIRDETLPTGRKPDRSAPVFLLGHSRGAAVGLIYTLDHPSDVSAMVAWNGTVNPPGVYGEPMLAEMKRNGRAWIKNARTGQDMPLDREIAEDLERHRERFDILGRIRSANVPIALIQGTDDYEGLVQGSARLVRNRPDVPWIRIEGGNHTFGAVHPFQGETEPLRRAVDETRDWLRQHWKSRAEKVNG